MSERERVHRLRVQIQRHKDPAIDPSDVEKIREGLLDDLSGSVALTGAAPALFFYYSPGVAELMQLGHAAKDPEQEGVLAAALHQFGGREGVQRAFRQGEALLPDEGGRLRRAACLLEVLEGERWWLAWRFFGQGEGGVGVQYGDWLRDRGEGWSELPEALRGWVDPGRLELKDFQHEETPTAPPMPDIQTAMGPWPYGLPESLAETAEVIGRLLDQEVQRQGLDALVVMIVRGEMIERWEIRGQLPCELDDMVRAFAGTGEPPEAVALLHPCTVKMPDGKVLRAVAAAVERGGRLATRLLPLSFPPEKGGLPVALAPMIVEQRERDPGACWIGVAPTAEINLTPFLLGGGPTYEA